MPDKTDDREYLLREEVAKKLRLTARSVDRLASKGLLEKVQLGPRRVGYPVESIKDYLKKLGLEASEGGDEGETYATPIQMLFVRLLVSVPDAGAKADKAISARYPGCWVSQSDEALLVRWAVSLAWRAEQIAQAVEDAGIVAEYFEVPEPEDDGAGGKVTAVLSMRPGRR